MLFNNCAYALSRLGKSASLKFESETAITFWTPFFLSLSREIINRGRPIRERINRRNLSFRRIVQLRRHELEWIQRSSRLIRRIVDGGRELTNEGCM